MSSFTLPDGLPMVHLPSDSQVVYCGIAVHAGTRHEAPDQHGLAHLCEHLMFKGTARRTARRIINDIEGLGGELNAFTNKEDTVYYCAIRREHLRRAVDVLCDIVFNSTFPQHEVEKEREVVCDEIDSYEDSPAELIYDEFENILFQGHPLGHNILGTAEGVRRYDAAHARRFTQQWYRPENSVFFLSGGGNIKLPPFTPLITPSPFPLPASSFHIPPSALTTPIVRHRGTHQAHVIMGTVAFAADDPRRWALYLLNNILGGPAMNSVLNLTLRERHALVYTVDSSMTSYSDSGIWTLYFGCDPADVRPCIRLVRRELDKLMHKPLSAARLSSAKQQLQGQLAIACENREQYVIDFARTILHTGKPRTLHTVMDHVQSVTPADIMQTAQLLFAHERMLTLVYTA